MVGRSQGNVKSNDVNEIFFVLAQVLIAGLTLSFLVAVLEFIWKARYSESDSDSSSGGDDRQGLCRLEILHVAVVPSDF